MYSYYNQLILIGDDSRYLFLKSILPDRIKKQLTDEKLFKNDIKVIYNEDYYIKDKEDKNVIIIGLNIIPAYKMLYIPKDIYSSIDFSKKNIDKLIIFNSFPYGKSNLIEEYRYLQENFNIADSLVILYKENRRFGNTDLYSEEQSIKEATKIYEQQKLKVMTYFEDVFNKEIFEFKPNFYNAFKNSYKNKVIYGKEYFEENFHFNYELNIKDFFNMFNLVDNDKYDKFNSIFSFYNVKESEDVWNKFLENLLKEYFFCEFGLLNIIRDFYMEFIRDISIWNIEKDLNDLDQVVVKECKLFFENHKILKSPKNQLEYIALMNKKGEDNIKVLFKKRIDEFIDLRLKKILYMKIKEKIDFIYKNIGLKDSVL